MATSIITGNITDAAGTPLQFIEVRVRLLPRPAFKTSSGAELAPTIRYTTDASGNYAMTLERTADITPAGSVYEVVEMLNERYGGPVKHLIQVGSSNTTVYASLISTPPAPITSVYLTQAAADARYVQSPGSFGGASDITASRPADTASAGALSTYPRADHKHSRETISGTAADRAALAGIDLVPGLQFNETDTFKWFKRFASSWVQYVVAFIGTAANKPATNYAGQPHYVTDATNITGTGIYTPDTTSQPARVGNMWWYNGTRWQYGEWGKPWGIVGYAEITGDVNFTTLANITGLSVTFTAAANRRIKITTHTYRVHNGTTDNESAFLYIRESTTKLQTALVSEGLKTSSGGGNPGHMGLVISPTAGAHTYVVSAERAVGANTHVYSASSTAPAFILIEDIGPNGAPA